ncbi:mechanosensitive ion channel family protein [Corynebacterium kroppenstedtii]|uniref:mechanosensitive ion channel family protein n=1 Tax=Corynebacterium sp. PCR 32 TaxID=3351342 RepID=UPI0030ABAE5E
MPFKFYLISLWEWVAHTGLSLAALICIALLIPRIGRLVVRWATIKMKRRQQRRGEIADAEGYKGRLAILGALVYIAEAIAFFFVAIRILKALGFSTTGAAVPATVVSAAVAFGAQKIIADFLAGFFIITERQYGIGDTVILQNSSVKVEGIVTAITLRSTTVRTVNGQEAVVPNSVPLVAINASSGWAKALIDIPVPISAADSTDELNTLFDSCVNRTLEHPEIARVVSNDPDAVSILPALDLIAPTSAGVPWAIKYRVLVRVEPGEQWTVERALRAAVMDEMWTSYSQSTIESIPGLTRPPSTEHALAHTQHQQPPQPSATPSSTPTAIHHDPATTRPTPPSTSDATPPWLTPQQPDNTDANEASHPAPTTPPTTAATTTATEVLPPHCDPPLTRTNHESTPPHHTITDNPTDPPTDPDDTRSSLEKEADDATKNGLFRNISYDHRIQRIFSIGGRCRPSTTMIVLILFLLIILQGLTYDGGDRASGILAPSSFHTRSTTDQPRTTPAPSTPTAPESETRTATPPTHHDDDSDNRRTTPTTTNTKPTTTGTTTQNNRHDRTPTDTNHNPGLTGNPGPATTEHNGGNDNTTPPDGGSTNSNNRGDNSGQANLGHAESNNNAASTMSP